MQQCLVISVWMRRRLSGCCFWTMTWCRMKIDLLVLHSFLTIKTMACFTLHFISAACHTFGRAQLTMRPLRGASMPIFCSTAAAMCIKWLLAQSTRWQTAYNASGMARNCHSWWNKGNCCTLRIDKHPQHLNYNYSNVVKCS